jgi:hypothetical protein
MMQLAFHGLSFCQAGREIGNWPAEFFRFFEAEKKPR